MQKPLAPINVFYSCSDSPTGAPLLEQLERHLSALQREGLIATWQEELDCHLNMATLILLIVSSDFLVSDYCYGTEMQRALQRHAAKEAQIIPIMRLAKHALCYIGGTAHWSKTDYHVARSRCRLDRCGDEDSPGTQRETRSRGATFPKHTSTGESNYEDS